MTSTNTYDRFLTSVHDAGAPGIVWVKPPVPLPMADATEAHEHERYEHLWRVQEEVAARHAGVVHLIDLAAWEHGHDSKTRPDEVHFTAEWTHAAADELVVPAPIEAALA